MATRKLHRVDRYGDFHAGDSDGLTLEDFAPMSEETARLIVLA